MILILDFGSQYTQLIARRVREAHVYCEIHPFNFPVEKIRAMNPRGIILSGGPASLYENQAPDIADEVLHLGCPVLGICYGLYVIAQHLGSRSVGSRAREFGRATLLIDEPDELFAGLDGREHQVW
ncbi:MAG TPA: GMP synthase (glutamine-hydrolyzing), partial [Candidatus Binataceae bacterium]|nr:GMP synthase (glutamine-hydrolyzing) [Candidatus Binataceae bacterium]